jgi:hypothetical protein
MNHSKDELTCNQKDCPYFATHYVYWPGENPPPVMCEKHAMKAMDIGYALGLSISTERINEHIYIVIG